MQAEIQKHFRASSSQTLHVQFKCRAFQKRCDIKHKGMSEGPSIYCFFAKTSFQKHGSLFSGVWQWKEMLLENKKAIKGAVKLQYRALSVTETGSKFESRALPAVNYPPIVYQRSLHFKILIQVPAWRFSSYWLYPSVLKHLHYIYFHGVQTGMILLWKLQLNMYWEA